MHILIAGATGAAGRALIPLLIANGHTVTGTTRSEAKAGELRALGATPQIMDGLDAASVQAAVEAANPDVIVHQMTALTGIDMRNIDKAFALTNRLRTEGTEHLLAAGERQAADRAVLRRLAVRAHRRPGQDRGRPAGPRPAEGHPRDPRRDPQARAAHDRGGRDRAALRRLLRPRHGHGARRRAGGDDPQAQVPARRQTARGVWSFLHTDDLATATLAAIEHGRPGEIYNIVDDEPAPVKEWLPFLAQQLGAKPPRKVPAWLARLVASPAAVAMMTESRGASNAKAKAELGWTPTHPSWRKGFAANA